MAHIAECVTESRRGQDWNQMQKGESVSGRLWAALHARSPFARCVGGRVMINMLEISSFYC